MINYFKDQKAMYEFILLNLSGKERNKMLNVKEEMFNNLIISKKMSGEWYNNILTKIEDQNAINQLNKIYLLMGK